jgi:hypothetical protein
MARSTGKGFWPSPRSPAHDWEDRGDSRNKNLQAHAAQTLSHFSLRLRFRRVKIKFMKILNDQEILKQAQQQEFADRCQKAQTEIQKIFEKYQIALAPAIEMRDMKQNKIVVPPTGTKTEK